jgi:D-alanine transaminase
MPELAYVNGAFMPIHQATVPIEDRGYQYADAVYEVIASAAGRLFCMEEHLERLERSMQALAFPAIPRATIRQAVEELFRRGEFPRAGVYIQVSRGVAPRSHPFPPKAVPQVIMTVRPVADTQPAMCAKGATAITVTDTRWGRCDIKTVQLLANVLAKQQALDAGAGDAIFVSPDKVVREGTSSNLFLVTPEGLATHPLTPAILGGITRMQILAICAAQGLSVRERLIPLEELFAAREVFFTGTITEVLPIVAVDGRPIGDGRPGPVARQLFQALRARMGAA